MQVNTAEIRHARKHLVKDFCVKLKQEYLLERVCSQTQLCQLRCFNDYIRQLHVSAPTGYLSGCLQENLRSYYI